ncbi:NUDIX domain-containing protein [Patescibacteria group bacterium]
MNSLKEYRHENGDQINTEKLIAPLMPLNNYKNSHRYLVIACHDVFIKYNNGILLTTRTDYPAKDILCPVGGRILKGISTEESLKKKVTEETNLKINNIKYIGVGRTFFKTDPFDHGYGTDTLNLIYFAEGEGTLKLNDSHKNPEFVTLEKYTDDFRKNLHPYVRDYMDIAINLTK